MASYAFRITGLAPTDSAWHTAGESVHRSFWREVVRLVLIEKDKELAAGKDRHGIDMIPIAESTRRKGRWRSYTGLGDARQPAARSRERALPDAVALHRPGASPITRSSSGGSITVLGIHFGQLLG